AQEKSTLPRVEIRNGSPTLILPESLIAFIHQRYPDLRIPTRADLSGHWSTFDKKNSVPYACWGQFDDKGKIDIALILLGKEEWRVLAFHPLKNDQYAVLPLEDYAGTTKGFSKAHLAQEFQLFNVQSDRPLIVEGKEIPDTRHHHDAVAFFS